MVVQEKQEKEADDKQAVDVPVPQDAQENVDDAHTKAKAGAVSAGWTEQGGDSEGGRSPNDEPKRSGTLSGAVAVKTTSLSTSDSGGSQPLEPDANVLGTSSASNAPLASDPLHPQTPNPPLSGDVFGLTTVFSTVSKRAPPPRLPPRCWASRSSFGGGGSPRCRSRRAAARGGAGQRPRGGECGRPVLLRGPAPGATAAASGGRRLRRASGQSWGG